MIYVRKELADGTHAVYVYESRGGELLKKFYGDSAESAMKSAKRWEIPSNCLSALIASWQNSSEFKALSAASKKAYNLYLKRLDATFGELPIKVFEDPLIKSDLCDWREEYAEKARTADYMITTVTSLFSWAQSRGLTGAEPTRKIRRMWKANRSDIIWTEDDLAKLREVCPPYVMDVVDFAAHTGLRQGDIVNLQWEHVNANHIKIETAKRGRIAIIPLMPKTKAILLRQERDELPFVFRNSFGAPWTRDGLRTMFYRARIDAGVEKHFHDLRGTAATNYHRAGLTRDEIALAMAWSPNSVQTLLNIYLNLGDAMDELAQKIENNSIRIPADSVQTDDKLNELAAH